MTDTSEQLRAYKALKLCHAYGYKAADYTSLYAIFGDDVLVEQVFKNCYAKGYKVQEWLQLYCMYTDKNYKQIINNDILNNN